jgi:hypothetical protein
MHHLSSKRNSSLKELKRDLEASYVCIPSVSSNRGTTTYSKFLQFLSPSIFFVRPHDSHSGFPRFGRGFDSHRPLHKA